MRVKPKTILICIAILGVPAVCFVVGGLHEPDLLYLGLASLAVSTLWIYSIVSGDLRYSWDTRRAHRTRLVAQPQWCTCRTGAPLQGWRCIVCRKPVATWRLQPRLLPRRATPVADSEWDPASPPPPPRPEPAPALPADSAILTAATTLVHSARVPSDEHAAAVSRALSDPSATRRMYVAAAHRLHPDHNGGIHLPEWFALQAAVELLRRYHEAQARAEVLAAN